MLQDTPTIWASVLTAIVLLLLFSTTGLMLVLAYLRRNRQLLLSNRLTESRFQERIRLAKLEAQEHTLQTVSQEIHDNVGQILSLAKVHLNIMVLNAKGPGQLLVIKEMVSSAICELRNLSMGYNADRVVASGLVTALRNQLQQLERMGGIATSFEAGPGELKMDQQSAVFLYRLMQEAMQNIVKHAHANRVDMHIRSGQHDTYIRLSDNGQGFDRADPAFKAGIGLGSMQQRANMIGASLQISSEKGKGTTLQLAFKH